MADEVGFETWLPLAQAGDEHAAGLIFRAYQPYLLRYLRSQEPRVAEDLAAEVWVAAAGALRGFDGDESGFRSWLFTVARRRVIEHRRKGLRRRTDPVDPDSLDEMTDDRDPGDRAAATVDAERAIELMSEHLSADQTEVLVLRVVADLTAAQVADLMGHTEAWVRLTQHRALKRLASHMDRPLEPA